MAGENKVILHGMWASPFSRRVELALKIKGIRYEYVDEDLSNKSEQLLKYNPVYKKVPVLVHNGKPIAESYIIIEYIDEIWKNSPHLLPEDPYQRAQVRFWASFLQQLFEGMGKVLFGQGDAKQKAIKEVQEKYDILENGLKEFFPTSRAPLTTENLGFLDIILAASFTQHKVYEEMFGARVLYPERNPELCSWINALNELPMVKDSCPSADKLRVLLESYKQKYSTSSN